LIQDLPGRSQEAIQSSLSKWGVAYDSDGKGPSLLSQAQPELLVRMGKTDQDTGQPEAERSEEQQGDPTIHSRLQVVRIHHAWIGEYKKEQKPCFDPGEREEGEHSPFCKITEKKVRSVKLLKGRETRKGLIQEIVAGRDLVLEGSSASDLEFVSGLCCSFVRGWLDQGCPFI